MFGWMFRFRRGRDGTACADGCRSSLAQLPPDLAARILAQLPDPEDVAAVGATCRALRELLERVLRARLEARGHAADLPRTLPERVGSWTQELLARERVLVGASAHSLVATGAMGDLHYAHFAFVDAEGGLHTCGAQNDDGESFMSHPALGHGGTSSDPGPPVEHPRRVLALASVRIAAVATAECHLLALSEAGRVYACGYNECGVLGLGQAVDDAFVPVLVSALAHERVVGIAAADPASSFALTAAGAVYSWGADVDGQLGHGAPPPARAPSNEGADDSEHVHGVFEPRLVRALSDVRIVGISAGIGQVTLALSDAGSVFGWGDIEAGPKVPGRCRRRKKPPLPRRIGGGTLDGVRAVQVSAGICSLVLDSNGRVHTFGDFSDHHSNVPALMPGLGADVRITAVSAQQCLMVDSEGAVYSYGEGFEGELGHGDTRSRSRATRISALRGKRAARVHGQYCHSLVVTADGSAYSFGDGPFGDKEAFGILRSTEMFGWDYRHRVYRPRRIQGLPPLRVRPWHHQSPINAADTAPLSVD